MLAQQRRALYRQALRSFTYLSPPARANLLRLLSPELRLAVQAEDWEAAQARVAATTTLFSSSPKLSHALASLSYHHYPGHIPHTHSRRNPSSNVAWNPDEPDAAMKAFLSDQRRRSKDVGLMMADKVLVALDDCVRQAERSTGAVIGNLGARRTA